MTHNATKIENKGPINKAYLCVEQTEPYSLWHWQSRFIHSQARNTTNLFMYFIPLGINLKFAFNTPSTILANISKEIRL